MDFGFFESLTPRDAQAYLARYLEVEAEATRGMIPLARQEAIVMDYSVASVPAFMKWVLGKLEVVSTTPDATLPIWLRHSKSYTATLFDFAIADKPLVMRASYYLGEAFVREYASLSWAVGDDDTAERNMPVVSGFRFGIEMAPILVTENLYRRIMRTGALMDIDIAVNSWQESLP